MDDIPYISHDVRRPMKEIKQTLKFKNNKIDKPNFY